MKRSLLTLTLILASLAPSALHAAPKGNNVLNLKESITDDAIIYPESFETDARKLLESWYMKNYTDTDDRYRTSGNPATTDAVIRQRLADLPTVIDMPFNQIVRSYIDRYMERGRPLVASLLGLGTYYMPIFEQALEAEQLPLELKYLPVIESALDPNAVSRSGAGGLWQFMPAAAKGYDLEISSLVDERRDPYRSSQKAARMLHDLYDTYGDWSLAIAAYNCGPGAVNKALRRAGGDPKKHDFWSIYEYLSPETRGYVPMFIAANYVMNYYKEHNISPVLPTRPLVTDTVGISSRVHFDQISKVLDIPKEELRILNPQFRADIIPGSPSRQYMLILPTQQIQAYIMSEDEIMAYDAAKYARRVEAEPGDMPEDSVPALDDVDEELLVATRAAVEDDDEAAPNAGPVQANGITPKRRTITHTVASGETISDIAARYEVRVSDIRAWNSLRRNAVRTGQKLRIETSVANAAQQAAPAKTQKPGSANATPTKTTAKTPAKTTTKAPAKTTATKAAAAKPVTHTIKNGESLTTIAKKYGVTVDALRKANGMTGDAIRAGKTLKIPAKGAAASSGSKSKATSSKKKSSTKKKASKKR
ncbi:MAG: LysM peptidoglycan-binding domain-containing protein [Muribaculaceae bacterium]|nr:LysM peptidoglycan-binding domain-containing protein [Muribaculaceae bacterium]